MTVFKQLTWASRNSVGKDSVGFPRVASAPFSTVAGNLEACPASFPLHGRSESPFLWKLAAACPGRQKSSWKDEGIKPKGSFWFLLEIRRLVLVWFRVHVLFWIQLEQRKRLPTLYSQLRHTDVSVSGLPRQRPSKWSHSALICFVSAAMG